MYPVRRRKYYNYKKSQNKYFSPYKLNEQVPNYYQKKGRIIQKTPLYLTDDRDEIITKKILDKYYRILKNFNYPALRIPQPPPTPPPPFDPSDFTFFLHTNNVTFDNLPSYIDVQWLKEQIIDEYVSHLPNPPTGFSYAFDLISLNFHRDLISGTDTSRFSFTWNSAFATQPISIISKTLDTTSNTSFTGLILSVPNGANSMRHSQIAYTATDIIYRFSIKATNDPSPNDDGFYPLITSNPDQETYTARIDVENSVFDQRNTVSFNLSLYVVSDDF